MRHRMKDVGNLCKDMISLCEVYLAYNIIYTCVLLSVTTVTIIGIKSLHTLK